MNPVFDPLQRKMASGPEAGQNVEVDGFEVSFLGASTSGVYNAGSGLTLSGNVFAADVANVGFGLELAGGTASYARYRTIETVSGGTVTLMAGHAYKAYATTSPLTITAENIPANMYGQEGHLEIFVGPTGYVIADPQKVVLADGLEPDSVNNLTVRFHDGYAILSVEDHVAGYIVVSATGTTAGTLPYGIASATQEYIAFDAALNGATIDLSGSTASGEKHIVGNGYASTTLTGSVDCGTSKVTVANLSLQDIVVNGGTMTLGDAYIPSGSTVAVSGGGLAVEKVTGAGSASVINLGYDAETQTGGVHIALTSAYIGGVSLVNGKPQSGESKQGGCLYMNDGNTISGCVISGNRANYGGGIYTLADTSNNLISSVVTSNSAGVAGNDVAIQAGASMNITGSTVGEIMLYSGGHVSFAGYNAVTRVNTRSSETVGSVTLTSGAVLDLTGNTNATPIAPGGGVTISGGGTQILTGSTAGVVEHTTTINGTGSFICNTISSDGKINIATEKRALSGELVISSASFAGAVTLYNEQNAVVTLFDCTNNAGYQTGSVNAPNGTTIVSGTFVGGAYQSFQGGTNIGTLILRAGATLTINGTYICATVGTVIVEDNVVCNGTVTITGGTYYNCSIHKDGTIAEA